MIYTIIPIHLRNEHFRNQSMYFHQFIKIQIFNSKTNAVITHLIHPSFQDTFGMDIPNFPEITDFIKMRNFFDVNRSPNFCLHYLNIQGRVSLSNFTRNYFLCI